jgi:hypothetical protein
MYGQLLAVAAYTAAIRDDRDTAWMLLAEAEQPAYAAGTSTRFNAIEIAVYRIGVAHKLGDYGAAVNYAAASTLARSLTPSAAPAIGRHRSGTAGPRPAGSRFRYAAGR